MSEISLESLGFTKEELQDRVIEAIVEQIMKSPVFDQYGEKDSKPSEFSKLLKAAALERVDAAIKATIETHIQPNAATYIENVTMQETNEWGEKTKKPVTFREYLVQRFEKYMTEKVNYEGKTKEESSYNWSGSATRVTHIVHKHLQYEIDKAVKEALSLANGLLVQGLQETAKLKLAEIAATLKVEVSSKGIKF